MLMVDKAAISQWTAALSLIPQARIYPQTASWQLADKILADGFIAYFRSFPNVPLAGIFNIMDVTIQDLVKK
jgi:hypothetical protein